MKIGILTFHRAHNYGAVLQCFCLQEYLKSIGNDVYVIDYSPSYLKKVYKKHSLRHWVSTSIKRTFKKIITEPFLYKLRDTRYNNFNIFINTKLNLYPYKEGMDYSEFDAIILGSDQIWEAPITGGKYDDVYFGKDAKCKVFSFAASNKANSLSPSDIKYYQSRLLKFTNIGVREYSLKSLLEPFINKKIEVNLDPTLLSDNIIKNTIPDIRIRDKTYVLVYEIIEHKEVVVIAKKYAKKINADVVLLSANINYDNLGIRDQIASPVDFINYIRHAECVFTTSFHGTALSILFERPFYSFKQHTQSDQRIESLVSLLGLTDRFVELNSDCDFKEINYPNCKTELNKQRIKSIRYLELSLKA